MVISRDAYASKKSVVQKRSDWMRSVALRRNQMSSGEITSDKIRLNQIRLYDIG